MSFGFDYGVNWSVPQVEFYNMTFDDVVLDLGGQAAAWDAARSAFFGNLFFELWFYNTTVSSFQFHQRAVWLWFNVTV